MDVLCWNWVNRDRGGTRKEEWSQGAQGVGVEGNRRRSSRGGTDHTVHHTDGEGSAGGVGSQLERPL